MVASAPVTPDVSEVAGGRADRPAPGPTGPGAAARWRQQAARILGGLVIAAALVLAALFGARSGIPDERLVPAAADLHGLEATLPVTGPPPVVGGQRFPALDAHGWAVVGGRRDRVGGRDALTAFYAGADGRRLALTILSGQPLRPPPGSRIVRREGLVLARSTDGDRVIVSWRRAGRTAVLSGVAAAPDELVDLARAATPRRRR